MTARAAADSGPIVAAPVSKRMPRTTADPSSRSALARPAELNSTGFRALFDPPV